VASGRSGAAVRRRVPPDPACAAHRRAGRRGSGGQNRPGWLSLGPSSKQDRVGNLSARTVSPAPDDG